MLERFIGKSQLSVMHEACKGEEGLYFQAMMKDLEATISSMPKTYETDDLGDEAIAVLHYFLGGSDFYIIEKDTEESQIQAFGFTILNADSQNGECGYINIQELIVCGVELDLHYRPETLGVIKARFK